MTPSWGLGDDGPSGDGGRDLREGGSGNDLLHGGSGNDVLAGGGGAEKSVWSDGDWSRDAVADFDPDEDGRRSATASRRWASGIKPGTR